MDDRVGAMDQRPVPPPPLISPAALAWLRKPQFLLPLAVVAGMIVVAFGIQPGGAKGETPAAAIRTVSPSAAAQLATATPTGAPAQAKSTATAAIGQAQATQAGLVQNQQGQQVGTTPGGQTATSDVAGVRGTPSATSTQQAQPDLSRQSTQCGSMQETSVTLAIEQTINGVSVKATKSSTYPIEYFRCILMATGTQEAFTLAS
jgi:hypothetical protein